MLMQGQGESSYSIFSAFLSLCRSEVLEPGDCGSWVVNYDTNEAYGHVVGSDAFGEAYIIPLHSTLAQRRKRLEAAWAEASVEPLHMFSSPEPSSQSEVKSFRKINDEDVIARAPSIAGPLHAPASDTIDDDGPSDSENLSELDNDGNEIDPGYGSRNISGQSSGVPSPVRLPSWSIHSVGKRRAM
ncbi:hypothetical protein MMC15_005377 [Xylographa vitiligo]|nr:hypothetical protein [Xylographa vitiligo]